MLIEFKLPSNKINFILSWSALLQHDSEAMATLNTLYGSIFNFP
jgi:hypothetical protein